MEPGRHRGVPQRVLPVVAGLVVAVTIGLIPVTHALACSCAGPLTDRQALRYADVAFDGVALSRTFAPDLKSSGDLVDYAFRIERQLKGGPAGDPFVVKTAASGAACGMGFQLGTRWRVFAKSNGHELVTYLCSGNRALERIAAPSPSPAFGAAFGFDRVSLPDIYQPEMVVVIVLVTLLLRAWALL